MRRKIVVVIFITGDTVFNRMGLCRLFVPIMALQVSLLGSSMGRATAFAPIRFMSRKQCSITQVPNSLKSTAGSKLSKSEKDPGAVKGTKLRILRYPNPKLRAENKKVSVFDEELATTAANMLKVMYAAQGIGLAAPQVGINLKLMVFNQLADAESDEVRKEHEKIFVNPTIVKMSDELFEDEEGCLSFPHIYGQVVRSNQVDVEYQTLTGEHKSVTYEGELAQIFQHEYDHLEGVLLVDRMDEDDKKSMESRLGRLVAKHGPGGAL